MSTNSTPHPLVPAFPFLLMFTGAGVAVWTFDWRWAVSGALAAFIALTLSCVVVASRDRRARRR